MAIISFGCKSIYQLLFLGCPLFFFLRELCFEQIDTDDKKIPTLFPLLIHISQLFSGILAYINKKKSKKEKVNSQDSSSKSYLYSTDSNGEIFPSRKKLWLWIVLSSLFQSIYVTGFNLNKFCEPSAEQITKIIPLIFIILLSKCFIQTKVSLHEIISAVFIYCGLAFLIIGNLENLENHDIEETTTLIIIILAGSILFFSPKQIMDKLLMDKYFISPFYLVFLQGALGLIFTIIISVIFRLSFCSGEKILNFPDFTVLLNQGNLLFIFLGIITTFGYNTCLMCLKKNYPPSHRILVDCICSMLLRIIQVIDGLKNYPPSHRILVDCICSMLLRTTQVIDGLKNYLVFVLIGYFIIFIASLFHNELLVFTRCSGTRNEMESRSLSEYSEAMGGLLIQVERREESGNNILIN